MLTHPYIARQLNSEHIAQFHVEAAADRAVRQARAARRQAKAKTATCAPRHIWFRRTAVAAPCPAV
jgi:hypothetical protein